MVHTPLHVGWQMLFRPGGFIVSVKAEGESLKPIEHLFDVILTSLFWHGIFDNREAITKEVFVPLSCRFLVFGVRHVDSTKCKEELQDRVETKAQAISRVDLYAPRRDILYDKLTGDHRLRSE